MASPSPPTTVTSTTTTTDFVFPRVYEFPPFFTAQTNLTTRHAQLTKWSALVLAFCRHRRIFRLSPSAAATDPAHPAAPLFHNARLSRRLSAADAREVLGFMCREDRAEAVGGGGGTTATSLASSVIATTMPTSASTSASASASVSVSASASVSASIITGAGAGGGGAAGAGAATATDVDGDVFWVYWRTPDEWAALVEAWVDETGQKGSVFTVYELTEGAGTMNKEFHGMDPDLLLKSLAVLVKRGKASIFGSEDSPGVKFF